MTRVGVIGCGSIGQRHASNLAQLGVDLHIVEQDSKIREHLADRLDAETHKEVPELLAAEPDGVVVATPTHLHLPHAQAFVDNGVPCLVEKPISHTLEGTDGLVALARERATPLFVACNMRFHEPVQRLRAILEEGSIGEPRTVSMHYGNYLPNWRKHRDYRETYSSDAAQGGGMVLEGIHALDLVRWLFGEPAELAAMTAQVSGLEVKAEDASEILFRLETGTLVRIHHDAVRRRRERGFTVVGSEGTAIWRAFDKAPEQAILEQHGPDGLSSRDTFSVDINEMYVREMRAFLDAIQGGTPDLLSGEGGRRVLQIALACRDAGGKVTAVPDPI